MQYGIAITVAAQLVQPGPHTLCINPLTVCEMHVQVGVFQVVHLGASAEQAYQRVQPLQPFVPFRDASCGPPAFNLSVQHCIQVKHQPHPCVTKCMYDSSSCHQRCFQDSLLISAVQNIHLQNLLSGLANMSRQRVQPGCWHAMRASFGAVICRSKNMSRSSSIHNACRVWQKQSRQVSLTGTCPTPHSAWKSMSTMSR